MMTMTALSSRVPVVVAWQGSRLAWAWMIFPPYLRHPILYSDDEDNDSFYSGWCLLSLNRRTICFVGDRGRGFWVKGGGWKLLAGHSYR